MKQGDVILVIVMTVVADSLNSSKPVVPNNHGWACTQHLLVDGHHMDCGHSSNGDALHGPADNEAALVVG